MIGSVNSQKLCEIGSQEYHKRREEERKLLSQNIGLRQLREEVSARWERVGLLDGLVGNVKEDCAKLFESQLSWAMSEVPEPELPVFPEVRRVLPTLLANEISEYSPTIVDGTLAQQIVGVQQLYIGPRAPQDSSMTYDQYLQIKREEKDFNYYNNELSNYLFD